MKKKDVQIGGTYVAKVSGTLTKVRITGESRFGGWDAVNLATKRDVRIRGAARLRRRIDAPTTDLKTRLAAGVAKLNAMLNGHEPEAATTTVAPVATEPTVGAVAQENPGDATLPTTVAQVEPQTNGQEGDETMAKQKAKKTRMIACGRCGRKLELVKVKSTFQGRCPCGVAWALGKRLVKITGANGSIPAVKVLEEPPTPEKKERKARERKDGKMSGLDAAAKVLADAGEPLGCDEVVKRMIEGGLWATEGKTPGATIYAAIIRDIAKKGEASRFRKADRGKFAAK